MLPGTTNGPLAKGSENETSFCETTKVQFDNLTADDIQAYVATGGPMPGSKQL